MAFDYIYSNLSQQAILSAEFSEGATGQPFSSQRVHLCISSCFLRCLIRNVGILRVQLVSASSLYNVLRSDK